MTNNKKIKCYCHWCGHDTNHDVLFSKTVHSDNDGYYWEEATFSVVRCCGCDDICFHRKVYSEDNIEEIEEGVYDFVPEIKCFPFDAGWIKPIVSFAIPHKIRQIYRESVEALNHGLDTLAGAGFRAVVEAICSELNIEAKNLEAKINKLTSQGIITKNDRNRLHAIRFIGNDSIHVLKKYSRDELLVALSIINGILNNLFIIDDSFRQLGERPVNTFEDFIKILDTRLDNFQSGGVFTLKNILHDTRKVLKDDLAAFETRLIDAIGQGKYLKLELCPPQEKGPQQYKIRNIDIIECNTDQ